MCHSPLLHVRTQRKVHQSNGSGPFPYKASPFSIGETGSDGQDCARPRVTPVDRGGTFAPGGRRTSGNTLSNSCRRLSFFLVRTLTALSLFLLAGPRLFRGVAYPFDASPAVNFFLKKIEARIKTLVVRNPSISGRGRKGARRDRAGGKGMRKLFVLVRGPLPIY